MSNEYSSLPTADYDESEEIRQATIKKQNKTLDSLQSLENSIFRVGELSLKISHEIELQNLSVHDLEENVEGMEHENRSLQRQSQSVVDGHSFTDKVTCAIIVLIIVILIGMISLKLYMKEHSWLLE